MNPYPCVRRAKLPPWVFSGSSPSSDTRASATVATFANAAEPERFGHDRRLR
jgi:hypothetical protein